MAYANKADMLARYEEKYLVQLTDREEPYQDIIVDDVLDAALNDASAVIDGFIGRLYKLPLADNPPLLIKICCVMAYYNLHRGMADDEVKADRKDQMGILDKIAQGKMDLFNTSQSEPKSAPADARVDGPPRIFNRDNLKGF